MLSGLPEIGSLMLSGLPEIGSLMLSGLPEIGFFMRTQVAQTRLAIRETAPGFFVLAVQLRGWSAHRRHTKASQAMQCPCKLECPVQ
jgi:hypothetical protein